MLTAVQQASIDAQDWKSAFLSFVSDRLDEIEKDYPQSHHGADQVSGFALFCTLAHPFCRIRFAFAMYRSLPIASFRPCRCQQRPCNSDCLPPGRGDACVPQADTLRHKFLLNQFTRFHAPSMLFLLSLHQ